MSVYLNDVADSVRAGVVAALPELLPVNGGGGVFELEGIEAVSYEDLTLSLPYASMRFSIFDESMDSPTACNGYQSGVEIVLVADVNGNNDNLRPLLERLRDYLRVTTFAAFLIVPPRRMDISDNVGANRVFISKGDTQRCGLFGFTALFGDGPTI